MEHLLSKGIKFKRSLLLWFFFHNCEIIITMTFNGLSLYMYPSWTKFRGVYGNLSVSPSVCTCADSSTAELPFFALTLAFHIWHMGVSPWEGCLAYNHDPDTKLSFSYGWFSNLSSPIGYRTYIYWYAQDVFVLKLIWINLL